MAKMIRLDFRHAPPSSGGGQDRIPSGRYMLVVSKVSEPDAKSRNSGKPMITVDFKVGRGDMTGKRLRDNFVFPTSADDQMFGLQRFHAMLIACGFQPPSAAFRFDLEMLIGKSCWCEVADNEIPADGKRPARTVSRPDEYLMGTQGQLDASASTEEEEDDEEYADDGEDDDDTLPFVDGEDDVYDDEGEDDGEDDAEEYAPEPEPAPEPVRARRPRPAAPVAEVAARQPRRAPAAPTAATAPPATNGAAPARRRRPAPPADDSAFPFAQT